MNDSDEAGAQMLTLRLVVCMIYQPVACQERAGGEQDQPYAFAVRIPVRWLAQTIGSRLFA